MSDFMMSQVKGLLTKVSEDMEHLAESNAGHAEMLLGAIDDLAANLFATQAVLSMVLKDNPVSAADAKSLAGKESFIFITLLVYG